MYQSPFRLQSRGQTQVDPGMIPQLCLDASRPHGSVCFRKHFYTPETYLIFTKIGHFAKTKIVSVLVWHGRSNIIHSFVHSFSFSNMD